VEAGRGRTVADSYPDLGGKEVAGDCGVCPRAYFRPMLASLDEDIEARLDQGSLESGGRPVTEGVGTATWFPVLVEMRFGNSREKREAVQGKME